MRLPELVSVHEIAAMLGVTRQRVQQLTKTKGFPPPAYRFKMGNLWLKADVTAWQQARTRRGDKDGTNDGKRPNAHHLSMPLVQEQRSH